MLKRPVQPALAGLLKIVTANKVASGPFVDLALQEERLFLPILLGTYEKEIHPWLREVACDPGATILNIGAGDGIYAVGLARMLPGCHVLAFETQEIRQTSLRILAAKNGVQDRLRVEGEFAKRHALGAGLPAPAIVLMDIEGFEETFLDAEVAEAWRDTLVVIETHDGFRAGNSGRLREVFSRTHHVDEVHTTPRSMTDWPLQGLFWKLLPSRWLLRAMFEERPFPQSWLRFRPKVSSATPVPVIQSR